MSAAGDSPANLIFFNEKRFLKQSNHPLLALNSVPELVPSPPPFNLEMFVQWPRFYTDCIRVNKDWSSVQIL